VVVFAVSPRSATGVACKAVTVGLLVSLLFLGKAFSAVVMSAPLFYVVAILIAAAMDAAHRRQGKTDDHVLFESRHPGCRPDELERRERLHDVQPR